MADHNDNDDKNDNRDKNSARNYSGQADTRKKKKVSSRLVLLQGIRRLAMPSRSFSEGTQNVSFLFAKSRIR